ncbi:Elongation factor 2 [Modicella reniformis]|uniref:Elongation factor 2 n=1 Tax=Modicella reniformis TaxID=1440133 RepID=A0A9P6M9F8_9FUNG|nr:Elongation factor 2 [Modicella reniformis]
MVPSSDKNHFYALGRVFSGTVRSGLSIRIQGPSYVPKKKNDLFVRSIERIVLLTGSYVESIESCPAGNIVGLVGIDQFLFKSGTITTSERAYNLKVINISVMPIIQVTVEPKDPSHLPKLVEGEHIVASSGEMHLESCLKELEEGHYCGQIPLRKSEPYVQYRETITAESPVSVHSKSPNRHNRVYLKAGPLTDQVTKAIENGEIPFGDLKVRTRILSEEYGWDEQEAKNIWSFGLKGGGGGGGWEGRGNVLVDMTRGVTFLKEIKESCLAGFQWVISQGVLSEEEMRGCRFNIMDVILGADATHRGGGQIIPIYSCVIYGVRTKVDGTGFLGGDDHTGGEFGGGGEGGSVESSAWESGFGDNKDNDNNNNREVFRDKDDDDDGSSRDEV